tara:strand:+ start:517 stop:888 length:372 start_codon:yes stop_codon:yes gene_type:complete
MLTKNNFFIGTDIVEIERIKNSIDKYGLKFIEKIYTPREIKYCQNKENCYPHFAGRFAAKESIKKAIFSTKIINQIDFKSIEIVNDSHGVPTVKINETLKIKNSQLSISHEKKYAVAFALLTV